MERVRVTKGRGTNLGHEGKSRLDAVFKAANLLIEADPSITKLISPDGRTAVVSGKILGVRGRSNQLERISKQQLGEYIFSHTAAQCRDALEGRYILVLAAPDGSCEVTLDRQGQADVFTMKSGDTTILSSELDLLPVRQCGGYQQASLAHLLSVYGYRPPKRHTIYKGIDRLGVGEIVRLNGHAVETEKSKFAPIPTAAYGERELNEYADTLLDAVEKRGSRYGNVVYLSSGWDSTAILASLVHIFGSRKVRGIIGTHNYSSRSGTINQFEIDRAKKMADYYGVRLDIVEFDYWKKGPEYLEADRETYRSSHISSITALNHMRLAEGIARTSGGDEAAFVGEISDGAHNLGFSQFVTIFHPALGFREYSDKMGSYLYGPTFLAQLEKGAYKTDPVYTLLTAGVKGCQFDDAAAGNPEMVRRQLLESFFLRNTRLPLYSRRNAKLLTKAGQDLHHETMSCYLEEAARESKAETLYSWYLHLYNSFHWQSSTVACINMAGDAYGVDVQMPFRDSRILDFLAAMPEDWGRGLEIRPTKYPLKWMLENRIDYPIHYQVGPHSYLYDVDPTFSHSAEILYGSSFTPYLKKQLGSRFYEKILDPKVFDMDYIHPIVTNYLDGKEVAGVERNDLFSLCMLDWASDYLRDQV